MTVVYDVLLKRHTGDSRGSVCIFYDEDRSLCLKEMKKYCRANGFTIVENGNRFTIGDIVLREREATGKVISETPYIKLFKE